MNADNHGEIISYQTEYGLTNIEVKIQDETVWLTQQQMADLFQTSRTNVVGHLWNRHISIQLKRQEKVPRKVQGRKIKTGFYGGNTICSMNAG
jgi:hypothetical protein